MTTFFSDDFESGDFTAWTSTHTSSGTITVNSSKPCHGAYSCLSQISGSGYADVWKQFSQGYSDVNARGNYCFQNLDAIAEGTKVTFHSLFTNDELHIGITKSGGSLYWYVWSPSSGITTTLTSVASPVDDQWYCIESKITKSTTNGQVSLWINGVNVYNATGINNGTNTVGYFAMGWRWRQGTSLGSMLGVYCDAAAVSDGSYIGPATLSMSLSDSLSATDDSLRHKTILPLTDAISFAECCQIPACLKQAVDSILVAEGVLASRVLLINDNACIVETVANSILKRNRLFLVLGDLAIQLTGD